MRSSIFLIALAVGHATASPLQPLATKRQAVDDTTVLNFALTLEHLENAFYHQALTKFDQNAFVAAGLPEYARGRFQQVADHEEKHVQFLTAALGDKATQPCTYNFPYTDPKSFAALSQVLEGVGVSAYAGAAQLITNKQYLTAAATILTTEARHASWVAAAVNKFSGWSGAFDVPLVDLNQVFTLAAAFITSCPSTNPALPVKAYPALQISNPLPDQSSQVTSKSSTTPTFIAFFSGLDTIFAPVQNGKVKVPGDLSGQIYAVGTTSGTDATAATIVSGPAILLFERNSSNALISSGQAN